MKKTKYQSINTAINDSDEFEDINDQQQPPQQRQINGKDIDDSTSTSSSSSGGGTTSLLKSRQRGSTGMEAINADEDIDNYNLYYGGKSKYQYQKLGSKSAPLKVRFNLWFRKLLYHWKHYFIHTLRVNLRNKLSYLLGFSACFLVVFIVALCVSIITNTPVVFLSLSESSVGEMDIIIKPGVWTLSNQLNYTMTSNLLAENFNATTSQSDLKNLEAYSYHSPRIVGSSYLISSRYCPFGDTDPTNNLWKYHNTTGDTKCEPYCFERVCSDAYTSKSTLYVIDTQREKRMGLGRDWNLPAPPQGTVYIQSSLAKKENVAKGDTVFIRIGTTEFLSSVWTNSEPGDNTLPFVYITAKVADTFTKGEGKFPSSEDHAIIIDYSTFIPFISSQLDPTLSINTKEYIKNTNLYDYSQIMIINFPPSRLEPYIDSNQDHVLEKLNLFSSNILYKIGFNQLDTSLPIMDELSKNRYVALFLGLILNVIIFILLFLSILLIYSLLMIDVETRTFEMGVMRMIGTTRSGIIQLMLFKAFSYSLPSWVLGLIMAQIFGVIVSVWFKSITGVPIPTKLTGEAVILSTLLGMIIPVASAIFPIRNALGKNLQDSLDIKHSKTSAVQISIERSEDNSFSSNVAIIGLLLTMFGFGIYYVFPLSLLSFNLSLLLNMFFLLLIAMLLGLVSLALNLEQLIERALVYTFLLWEKKAIKSIVLKNLVAHKLRNRKTAIMYAVSLGFIIFVNVSYSMQQASMNYQVQQSYGSYLRINSETQNFSPDSAAIIEQFLSSYQPEITDFSWVSSSFSNIAGSYQDSRITNLGHIYTDSTHLYSVSPNFFSTTLQGFLNIAKITPNNTADYQYYTVDDLSEYIYSNENAQKVVVGSLYSNTIGANLDQPVLLQLKVQLPTGVNQTRHVVTPMALVDSAPTFTFSKFPSVLGQDSLVSYTSFMAYSQDTITSVREIPFKSVILQLNTNNEKDIETIKSKLVLFLNSNLPQSYRIADYYDKIAPNKTASTIIQYFFSFTTVVAMIISFFSLMSSMFTNIYEQTKEIGILRAVGIPKNWMVRIYIYESFILVLSSSLLGVFIGTVVGWTMILQRVLFTQLPIPFEFPWVLLIVIFICSLVFSFFSAFGPIRKVLNQPVVNIMRIVI
ncbi:hypothetical protein CYY_005917 [Polysphondylium violaceum]|uniref:ABC3 transporter permease C-terminal domain-containing protein n=1 Tax=Polysphondylium violaceum TaxID=133409 RepID=A0A8J4PT26_9MYCE|nr:hypothetical protein CYY_005917 [Polysphondylium violaceum]